MTVTVQGDYRQDAREVMHTGTYAFSFSWMGSIEKDPDDYLLVHTSCDLTHWEAEERATSAQHIRTLTTENFPDKPELNVNYILERDGLLYFDFIIRGFEVPLGPAPQHFTLRLPASEENAFAPGGNIYNPHVQAGSNKVFLEEKRIKQGPLEKSFAWTWKYQTWVQQVDNSIFQSNSHKVKVKVSVTPRK